MTNVLPFQSRQNTAPAPAMNPDDLPWYDDDELERLKSLGRITYYSDTIVEKPAPLRERTLLVRLNTRAWRGKVVDKDASRTVEREAGAEEGAGVFHKFLVDSDKLRRILRIQSRARNTIYEWTLPWSDRGERLIATGLVEKLIGLVRDHESELDEAVDEFLDAYPDEVDKARKRLGSLFQQAEYPDVYALRHAFRMDLNVTEHASEGDLRLDLSSDDLDYLNNHRWAALDQAAHNASTDLLERLVQGLRRLAERLNDPGHIIRKSLVETVEHSATLVRAYGESLALDGMDELLADIDGLTAPGVEAIRHQAETRRESAKDAERIADKTADILRRMRI